MATGSPLAWASSMARSKKGSSSRAGSNTLASPRRWAMAAQRLTTLGEGPMRLSAVSAARYCDLARSSAEANTARSPAASA
jgi:hypothetical protein